MSDICHIPLGASGEHEAVVDARDYAFLARWRWQWKTSTWQFGRKVYAKRSARVLGRRVTIYMAAMVCELAYGPPPTPEHTADHRDGDSLNNRRRNLRWATKSQQSANQRERITPEEIAKYEVAA